MPVLKPILQNKMQKLLEWKKVELSKSKIQLEKFQNDNRIFMIREEER